ncbi:hypothetical protein PMKS-000142 [Pichia membranifaciens]|uniref:Major facilitator superfamily (MFS) profile domain-containing protein n=1 Tax=Pichia membranifaciens TaxID=4926 RepID=A0A1Q2YAX6_9ASCO|nr:hypothetical protein PMKS-000142 [Pichia membranifaciens]
MNEDWIVNGAGMSGNIRDNEKDNEMVETNSEQISNGSQEQDYLYYGKDEGRERSPDEDRAELELERLDSIRSVRDAIPDKFTGRGLTSVIGCAFFNFNTWGANSAYALYLQEYLKHSDFEGASKYSYAIVGGLAFSSGLIFSPLINLLVGTIGIKPTISIGILLYFVAIMLASFATKLWHIYCTQGVLSGVGMALICVANINIVPQWFKGGPGGKRNVAMGIQAAGSGLGGIIYNIGLEPLLRRKTFRWSLRAQSIMCLGLNIFAVLLVKSRNASIKPVFKVYDRLVWSNFGCLCLVFYIMFTLFGYVVLMYNLGDFTRSLGYTSEQSSVVSTMVAVGIIYGRPSVGKIGDIIGPVNVTILASWLVALFTWSMWIPCRNYATAIVFAMFVGSLMGTIWLTMASINASIVGLKKFGIAMSISWIACGVFGFASPIIGIALKKNGPTNPTQYQPPAIFVGLCYFMAGATLVVIRGWLISRNSYVKEETENEDDVLEITVSPKETISNLFAYRKV